MSYRRKAYSSPVFNEVACLNNVQKRGSMHAVKKCGKKIVSWTSFLIRNDFGMKSEEHESIGGVPLCMRMM
jgi:hypothetical protein